MSELTRETAFWKSENLGPYLARKALPRIGLIFGALVLGSLEAVCRRQALISWVTRRTRRRERIEMKAISMKATRCPSVRSKMVFNRR